MSLLLIVGLVLVGFSANTEAAEKIFKDVSKDHYGYEDVQELVKMGVIDGFPDDTFRPHKSVTRAQAAVIIGKTLDVDTSQSNKHKFSDVSVTTTGSEYIYALANQGVFVEANKFNPYDKLTRAQMATILAKAFSLTETDNNEFQDVPASHWAYDSIQKLVAANITQGTSQNSFSPNDSVSRLQMAFFINRTLEYLDMPKFDSESEEILYYTNIEREKNGLEPLKLDQRVQKQAMIKAEDMYVNDYFDHISPVHGSPFDMLKKEGILYKAAGENIAMGYQSAKAVVEGWMNSPGHRENILNRDFTHLGSGYYNVKDDYANYHVQIFIGK